MKLSQILTSNRIRLNLPASNAEQVIGSLVDVLANVGDIRDRDTVYNLIIKREHEVGTGIGYGVAIPHSEPGPFERPLIAFARLDAGVDFRAPDHTPANLIFLLLTPQNQPGLHIRMLARICRLIKRKSLREGLLNAETPDEIIKLLATEEKSYPELTV